MNEISRWSVPAAFLVGCLLVVFLFLATTSLAAPGVENSVAVQAINPDPGGEIDEPQEPEVVAQGAQAGSGCQVSEQFPNKILKWCEIITQYANQHNLEPDLIAALILQESGGNSQAYSHSGAVGLMQVMPRDGLAAKFICANGPCFKNRPTIQQLEDPEFNVSYGTRMLAGLVKRSGSLREALKSYGPMDVGYSYSETVLALYRRYGD
ncbi:MAG: transglycosylase SLT domain-containing protein [Anaerolineales bacterium]|jgi:hypothetical protein|nr:transglycosylase SLT domain-containing protein [Anaerolineales bacterium]